MRIKFHHCKLNTNVWVNPDHITAILNTTKANGPGPGVVALVLNNGFEIEVLGDAEDIHRVIAEAENDHFADRATTFHMLK